LFFGGNVLTERNTVNGDWSDYIMANGKKIARAANFEDRIQIQGTNCSNCGAQSTGFTIGGISWLPYVIQSGDRLMFRQYQLSGSHGGAVVHFTDGGTTSSLASANDQDGNNLNNDSVQNIWHLRRIDLSGFAGKTIDRIAL